MRMGIRRNSQKRRLRFRLSCFLIASCVLIAGIYILYRQSFFPIKEVVFYGNKHLSEEEMKGLMGLRGNEDLMHVRCSLLAERLFQSPWVKSVSIRKEYPHRLLIKIIEAEPFALFETGDKVFIIDEGGRKLEELKGESAQFLPVISAHTAINPSTFSEAVSLIKAVGDIGMSGKQLKVTGVDSNKECLEMIIDGTVVRIGDGQYDEKLTRFLEIESEIKKRWESVAYIDLRFANRVVVKPLKEVFE